MGDGLESFHRTEYSDEELELKLSEISIDDLKYVEKDLLDRDKVSLLFLLYADDQTSVHVTLQNLLVLYRNEFQDSNILEDYGKYNKNWKKPLLEALCIIDARKIIRKWGFNFPALNAYFNPGSSPLISHDINAMVKILYYFCEKMTLGEGGNLILSFDDEFPFFDVSYLEVYLLYWISESKISIDPPNVDILLQYLEIQELKELRSSLSKNVNVYRELTSDPSQYSSSNASEEQDAAINHQIKQKSNFKVEVEEEPSSVVFDRMDAYNVRFTSAGLLLIINQRDFHRSKDPSLQELLPKEELAERTGTDRDTEKLTEVFKQFGYKINLEVNLKHDEIIPKLKQAIKVKKRSLFFDSLIVCVLSHGIEGHFYGSDSIPFKIDRIKEYMLTRKRMLGKPKILLVQACQGNLKQKPVSFVFASLERHLLTLCFPTVCDSTRWPEKCFNSTGLSARYFHGSRIRFFPESRERHLVYSNIMPENQRTWKL